MVKTMREGAGYVQLLHELVFSLYLPFLVVSAHEAGGRRWAVKLIYWGVSHGYLGKSFGMEDYRVDLVDFLFLWTSVVLIFFILRLSSKLSITRLVLKYFAVIVAVAGFPVAALYQLQRADSRMLFFSAELILVGLCLVLWMRAKWPVSNRVSIVLLLVHYAFWSILESSPGYAWYVLWPFWQWAWPIRKYMWLAYPLIGLCSTLLWSAYFKRSETTEELGSLLTAEE